MRGLQNKRVLITGGASGIGAATAARFLDEGSQVVVLDRDEKGRAAIQKQLPKLAGASLVGLGIFIIPGVSLSAAWMARAL